MEARPIAQEADCLASTAPPSRSTIATPRMTLRLALVQMTVTDGAPDENVACL